MKNKLVNKLATNALIGLSLLGSKVNAKQLEYEAQDAPATQKQEIEMQEEKDYSDLAAGLIIGGIGIATGFYVIKRNQDDSTMRRNYLRIKLN